MNESSQASVLSATESSMVQDATFFEQWLTRYLSIGPEYTWMATVFVLVFATLVVAFIARKVFDRIALRLAKTNNHWDDILFYAMRRPLIMLIWLLGGSMAIIGGSFALSQFDPRLSEVLVSFVQPLRKVGFVLLIAWFLIRFIRQSEQRLIDPQGIDTTLDHTTVSAFGKLLRLSIIITVSLVVLQSMGYSISGVLAFGGIGGIAIGFAAKDLLANFFGGLMIYMDRPFKVGDWVRSPDKEIEGTVEDIGWRLTRIRTFDQRPLYVPNSTFTSIAVENPSRMTNRRIYETIGVRYCDIATLKAVLVDVRTMLEQHPEIDTRQTLMVNFNQMAASSLEFFVYTFTKTTNWAHYHEVKQDVLFQVAEIIERHGAQVAFPTTTVQLEVQNETAPAGQSLIN